MPTALLHQAALPAWSAGGKAPNFSLFPVPSVIKTVDTRCSLSDTGGATNRNTVRNAGAPDSAVPSQSAKAIAHKADITGSAHNNRLRMVAKPRRYSIFSLHSS